VAGPIVRIHLPPAVSQANLRIAPRARPDLFVERHPELLAHHLTAAGDNRAGSDSVAQSGPACHGTLSLQGGDWTHFDRRLGLLPALSDPPERDRCEIESRV
jgi:hypothetical protein